MKKFLIIAVLVVLALVAGGTAFKEPLLAWLENTITRDMFVSSDTDSFDPGLTPGTAFPAIRALHRGREIKSIDEFVGDKGMVFIAQRSADW